MHPLGTLRCGRPALEARRAALMALVAASLAFPGCSACSRSLAPSDAGNGTSSSSSGTSSSTSGGSTSGGTSSSTTESSGSSSGSTGSGTTVCLEGCQASSSGSSSGSSGSTGASGQASSGSSGANCAGAGGSCALVNCCAGLSCDLSTNLCVSLSVPDAGDAGSSGCGLSGDGGSCLSIADCATPLACDFAGGSTVGTGPGVCGPPGPTPSLQCTANGHSCGAGSPACCGGPCVAGTCEPRTACALLASGCSTSADCCAGLTCTGSGPDGGTCTPSCAGELAFCQTDSDCCLAQGLSCLDTIYGSLCYPELPTQPIDPSTDEPMPCAGPCSAFECQLGAACELTFNPATGAEVDPCAQAGLVCDESFSVCRAPGEFEECVPGGPACQPIADSTVSGLQCVKVSLFTGNPYVCVQPCLLTADCVDPLTTCQNDGALGQFCFYSICQSYFASCPSSGANDGLCVPYPNGGSPIGICEQATLTGGKAGSACVSGGNRQVGGLCDTQDFCVLGLCSSVCNAGTSGGPTCPGATADGGPVCVGILGDTGDADDLGTCSPVCNFVSDAGGGCVPPDGGAPEKCLPQLLFGLNDVPTGLCVLGPTSGLPAGQPCDAYATIDDCADGERCVLGLFNGTAGAFCAQLCDLPGLTPGGCLTGQSCVGFQGEGFESSSTGYCATVLADGGQLL